MKIYHISDLHLCKTFKKENIRKTKLLIKHISEQNPDHLIITGDISDNAVESDYIILKKILQAFNLYTSEKTTILPGNHDIFGGIQKVDDIVNFPSKCKKTDDSMKLKTFTENFSELFKGAYFPIDNENFPFAKPLNGLLLIGLNTVDKYSSLRNPMASNGKIRKKQLRGLKELLNEKSFNEYRKIILTHHHFYKNCDEVKSSASAIWHKIEKITMKLRGKRKLINLFSDSHVDLVLHGHSHDMKHYTRRGVLFINSGGSIENNSPYLKSYQIDLEGSNINCNLQLIPAAVKNNEKIPVLA